MPVSEGGQHVLKRLPQATRRLEGYERPAVVLQRLEELAALARARGEEAEERELAHGEAGRRERGQQGGGAGHGDYRVTGLDGGPRKLEAGVADAWRSGLGGEGDVAGLERGEDLRRSP